MRFLLVSILLSSCVTYPRFAKRYACDEHQKERMAVMTQNCIEDVFSQNRREKADDLIEHCRSMALRSSCIPKKYIEKISLPLFDVAGEVPCEKASTAYELWICE